MRRAIRVFLGDGARLIGTLRYDARGARENAAFEYEPAWLAAGDGFALEPGLPMVAGPQFHRKARDGSVFHAAIADTEPDGWGKRVILRDHVKRRQRTRGAKTEAPVEPLNSLDFLLSVDDLSRVGALRLQDEDGVFQRAPESGRRTAPPLMELQHLLAAARAVETNTETAADLAYLRGRGTSLGGLRPKCTVIDDDGHLAIGKFPSVTDERAVTKGEVKDMEELWRRIAFSIRVTNVDDHLRNHGFVHVERGKWRLSPAFDLNPFPERIRELKTWISEETGPEATIDALMSVAPYCRIAPKRAKSILGQVERAVTAWRKMGRSIGMTAAEMDQFADAFEHSERW